MRWLYALVLAGSLAWTGTSQACWWSCGGCWGGGYSSGCWGSGYGYGMGYGGGGWGGGWNGGWGGGYHADANYGGPMYASGQMMMYPQTAVPMPSITSNGSSTSTGSTTTDSSNSGTVTQTSGTYQPGTVIQGGYYTPSADTYVMPAGYMGYTPGYYNTGYYNGGYYYPGSSVNVNVGRYGFSTGTYPGYGYYGPGYGGNWGSAYGPGFTYSTGGWGGRGYRWR